MSKQKYLFAEFECPSCGNKLTGEKIAEKFIMPVKCVCGRRGWFRFLGTTAIYNHGIVQNPGIKLNFLMKINGGCKI